MEPREVLDETTTPEGRALTLVREGGYYRILVEGELLMTSKQHGSEDAMAAVARAEIGELEDPRILVGGLGMGFTLRAVLDEFGPGADVHVAELLPAIIRYNRGPLAELAGRPLEDRRVTVHEGDVRERLGRAAWDVILLDVDNGPHALTSRGNDRIYDGAGVRRLRSALDDDGVLVVWSGYPSDAFVRRLDAAGFACEARRVRARWPLAKGPTHTLFVARPAAAHGGRPRRHR